MVAFISFSSSIKLFKHKFDYSNDLSKKNRRSIRPTYSNVPWNRKVWSSSVVFENQNTTYHTASLNERLEHTYVERNDKKLRPVVPILMGSSGDIDR